MSEEDLDGLCGRLRKPIGHMLIGPSTKGDPIYNPLQIEAADCITQLRKDAARYRWLREGTVERGIWVYSEAVDGELRKRPLDAAIDSALGAQTPEDKP